jgi:hypothetical protein
MIQIVRYSFIATSVVALVLAAGFFFQLPWATGLWPWPTSRLSNIFIASILAASAVPVLWIGLSGELAAITGGAINLCLTYLGMAAFSFHTYSLDTARRPILLYGIACIALAALCFGLIFWSRRISFRDTRPLPRGVRVSFVAFLIILILVGSALVLHMANIFPWRLGPEQSVLYGWIFLGAACYFLYALINPKWPNAQGQLLGFLAYDVVLIVPFLNHFATVDPRLWINLVVYTGVIVYSGLLAIYYLLLDKATRFGISGSRTALR